MKPPSPADHTMVGAHGVHLGQLGGGEGGGVFALERVGAAVEPVQLGPARERVCVCVCVCVC
jgi:hypothetical protein